MIYVCVNIIIAQLDVDYYSIINEIDIRPKEK